VPGAAGIQVYRADNSEGPYAYLASKPVGEGYYEDTGLPASTTYYYKVRAYNNVGESGLSDYASATTASGIPAAPIIIATDANQFSTYIDWKSVSGASGYRVYRADNSEGPYSTIGSTSYNAYYMDTGLAASTTYYYKVSAYNSVGESGLSDYASATTLSGIPAAPAGVTAEAQSSSSIRVSWKSVSGATNYVVYRAAGSEGPYANIASTGSASYTDTGLSANTAYYYKVSAGNDYGEGAQSYYATTKTSINRPAVPANVTAVALPSIGVRISWTPVPGAASYFIYSATSPNGSYTNNSNRVSTTASYQVSMSFVGGVDDMPSAYYYKVAAYNSAGQSALSDYASVTTIPPGPMVWATAGSPDTEGSLFIQYYRESWAIGYRIYRATNPNGSYELIASRDQHSSSWGSYTDKGGLYPNTTYYYKVTAYNYLGESDMSSVITGTTSSGDHWKEED
jgi:fibronectin type 3 domain-containing protein